MKSLMLAILVFHTSPSVFSQEQEALGKLAPSADSQQNAVCKIELIEIDRSKMRQIGIDWKYDEDSFPKQLDGNLKKSFKLGLSTLEKGGLAEIGFSFSTIVSSKKTNEFKAVFENRDTLIILDISKLFTDESNKNFLLLMTLEQKADATSLPR